MAENILLTSALWIGLALAASLISIRVGISVALIEIVVGTIGGNVLGLSPIDQEQYTVHVMAVSGGAVVPTLIAQRWFQPVFKEA